MSYEIVYKSATGNTLLLAEEVRKIWGSADCIYFGEPKASQNLASRIAIGFWTDKGTCSNDLQEYLKQLHQKQIFLFGTAGFGGSSDYFDRILKNVEAWIPKDNTIIGTFMCQGRMPQGIRERYQKALEDDPQNQKMKDMIDNFDLASTHPDETDLNHLREILQTIES